MSGSRIRILLLEDDAADAEIVRRAIRDAETNMELLWVTRISEAIEALARQSFDVVLSDLSLPDSNRQLTVERLHCEAADVPIVVLTSIDDDDLARELLDAGVQDYIPKDLVTGDILDRAIRHAIQRMQLLVETQRLLREVQDGRDLLACKNRKLEKLFQQAHDFVDNVSHEFRTPLTVIREYASLVFDGLVGEVNGEQIRMLKIVEDRADDLNTMVDDMLDSSKLKAGLVGAWRKPCDVAEILRHVTATLNRKAHLKGVQLGYEFTPNLPEVYCDAEKIGRVLTNLAVNAIKFCGETGVVQIKAQPSRDLAEVVFEVQDNGPGIEETRLRQIFERFEQLDVSTARGSCKGFGLGLAIAKDLVDLNLGRMTVDSTVGQGSTFRFTVPRNEPLELMRRYLRRVEQLAECPSIISLVVARVEPEPGGEIHDGIDGFLNYMLRRNDFLLPGAPGKWFLALPTDRQEVDKHFERSQQAWEDANRNRPFGPLPQVDYQWLGAWRTPAENTLILEEMTHHVGREELAHA